MQCTTMYATAYIQVSNLELKPSKTKVAGKKKSMEGGVEYSAINVRN